MTSNTRIRTDRLRLRSWRPSDAEQFDEACNTAPVMRWLGGVQPQWQLEQDVAYFIESESRDGVTFWVVERIADCNFLGFCGLVRIPDEDCPFKGELEIGWRIRESAWRLGCAFEAATAVLHYGFHSLRADFVVSRTASANIPSQMLMAKLGFVRRRDLDYRPAGETEKLMVFSSSREAWKAGQSYSKAY